MPCHDGLKWPFLLLMPFLLFSFKLSTSTPTTECQQYRNFLETLKQDSFTLSIRVSPEDKDIEYKFHEPIKLLEHWNVSIVSEGWILLFAHC